MRPTLEVADIFRRCGPHYRQTHADALSRAQRRAMSAMELCRTPRLAVMSSSAMRVAISASPATRAAITAVRSASRSPARNGSHASAPSCAPLSNISTSSSHSPSPSPRSRTRTRRPSRICCFSPAPRRCARSPQSGTPGRGNRLHRGPAHVVAESAAPSAHALRDAGRWHRAGR